MSLFGKSIRPTIVIPDVHGTTHWQDFVSRRKPGDQVVFLGDYFDRRGRGPFAKSEVENFLVICNYVESHPDTHLLVGNHDFIYLPWADPLSDWGRQEQMKREALLSALPLLKMAYVERSGARPVVFSHGGVTNTYLNIHELTDPADLNWLWQKLPMAFEWKKRNPLSGEYSRLDGDNVWQPPTWTRSHSLACDGVVGYDQVIGHTPVRSPWLLDTVHGDRILHTCTLDASFQRLGG